MAKKSSKQKNTKHELKKSPRYSRLITEEKKVFLRKLKSQNFSKFIKKHWLAIFAVSVSIFLLILLAVIAFNVFKNEKSKNEIFQKRANIEKQIKFWQNIVEKYPDYRDAYLRLSMLEYQVKNYNMAKEYLKKSLEIDPNYKGGRQMEKML